MTRGQLLRLTRPVTLAATVSPVAVGAAVVAASGRPIAWGLFALMAVVGMLLQVATNMSNEYHDHRRGVDSHESTGIAGVIVSGELTADAVRRVTAATYLLAVAFGGLLALYRGPLLFAMGLLVIYMSYLYSGGRRPISATAFGEAYVFLLMGPLEVSVVAYAAGGALFPLALPASLSVGLSVAAILLANNLRDRVQDAQRGRRTVAIILGERRTRGLLAALLWACIAWPALAALLGLLPRFVALTLLAAPLALRAPTLPNLRRILPMVAGLHMVAGLLLALGLGVL